MELNIEYSGEIGQGNYPDFLQLYDTIGQQFYVKNGEIYGRPSQKIVNGEFGDTIWLDESNVSPDTDVSLLEIKTLAGFGVVGSYLIPTAQKMIIYEFEHDVSKYLDNGSINFNIDTPITSFSLSLENPIDDETEIEGNIMMNEKFGLLYPGAKVVFRFSMGDSLEEVELGSYYIDRSNFTLLSETVSVDGRNLIGKALKEQTLNDNNIISLKSVTDGLKQLLNGASLGVDDYEVEYESKKLSFEFKPNQEILSAIEEILKSLINWRIEETLEGEILIGKPDYSLFPQRGTYNFKRGKDIFSRQIVRDDQQVYSKVCVHDNDMVVNIYKDVKTYSGWNLNSNKTLFVDTPYGTKRSDMHLIGEDIARRLANVGKIETFIGPFRPQLLVGDSANIIDEGENTNLGLITEISHNFGKNGFTTSFTVDSGGSLGRGRLSDFINMIGNKKTASSISYEDILPEEPVMP